MKIFRLIRSRPASAAYNMALDEKIFQRYLDDGVPVLRVYRWKSPAFTYGFSQRPEEGIDTARCLSDGVECVKRMTGGGVLFHNDEITYSFACGKQDVREPDGVFVSYRTICAFLARFYASLGLHAVFALESEGFRGKCALHELCSASFEKYDLVLGGKKIGGNAQKRKRQAIFQHGSVPCSIDWNLVRRYAFSLPGDISETATALTDWLNPVPSKDILEQKLIGAFRDEFGVSFIEEKDFSHETCVA